MECRVRGIGAILEHHGRVADVPLDIADRLYAAPPDGFVAARAEAAAQAKAAGDPAGAKEILKLRRPTIAAWLVNLLAIRRRDLIAEFTGLAAALRAAQRELRGDDLRELSAQRRAAVAALVTQARELATQADPALDPARLPLAEVETTLNAAMSDGEVAAQLTAGRLIRAVTYTGFGEVPRPQLRLLTGGGDEPRQRSADGTSGRRPGSATVGRRGAGEGAPPDGAPPDGEPSDGAAVRDGGEEPDDAPTGPPEPDRAALRRELATARTGLRQAETELEEALAAERDGVESLTDLDAQLAELERRRSAADQELSRRKLARRAAERAAVAARRRVGDAQAATEAVGITDDDVPPDRSARTGGRGPRKGSRRAQSGG
jgi:hypothetical protein